MRADRYAFRRLETPQLEAELTWVLSQVIIFQVENESVFFWQKCSPCISLTTFEIFKVHEQYELRNAESNHEERVYASAGGYTARDGHRTSTKSASIVLLSSTSRIA